jgi:hypothetical protein
VELPFTFFSVAVGPSSTLLVLSLVLVVARSHP